VEILILILHYFFVLMLVQKLKFLALFDVISILFIRL